MKTRKISISVQTHPHVPLSSLAMECLQVWTRTDAHTYRHARTHAHTHTHARTHARTHTHTRMHARTHARTHTHSLCGVTHLLKHSCRNTLHSRREETPVLCVYVCLSMQVCVCVCVYFLSSVPHPSLIWGQSFHWPERVRKRETARVLEEVCFLSLNLPQMDHTPLTHTHTHTRSYVRAHKRTDHFLLFLYWRKESCFCLPLSLLIFLSFICSFHRCKMLDSAR